MFYEKIYYLHFKINKNKNRPTLWDMFGLGDKQVLMSMGKNVGLWIMSFLAWVNEYKLQAL